MSRFPPVGWSECHAAYRRDSCCANRNGAAESAVDCGSRQAVGVSGLAWLKRALPTCVVSALHRAFSIAPG